VWEGRRRRVDRASDSSVLLSGGAKALKGVASWVVFKLIPSFNVYIDIS